MHVYIYMVNYGVYIYICMLCTSNLLSHSRICGYIYIYVYELCE